MPNPSESAHVVWGGVEDLYDGSSTDESNLGGNVNVDGIEFRQQSSSSEPLSSSGGQINDSEEDPRTAASQRGELEQSVALGVAASSWQGMQSSVGPEADGPESDHEQFFGGVASSSPPMGEELLPSIGSWSHAAGTCRPCRFVRMSVGCKNGYNCLHCHLCARDLPRAGRPSPSCRANTKQFVAAALGQINDLVVRAARAEELIRNARGRHYSDYVARVVRWTLESLHGHAVQEDEDAQPLSPGIVAPVPDAATLSEMFVEAHLEDGNDTETHESPRGNK